ncbi:hypothetical protein N7520_008265 [Penicillium odoratum]|uniref:uncharacterized protein n=1 Tax=Penicillium odoratum TaxID=1167516 RepID=UPI002548D48D|nr:uncharacterized protein N7520_008265 [Penicillium odoratum]KAJ5761109.1 hypothetical protein N7520_008265 [Penicillium odoratum]
MVDDRLGGLVRPRSGISGGAIKPPVMIAGRSIQGVEVAGINVMIDMIVSDMLRGNFMGMIFAVFTVGTFLGPFIGGVIVQHSSWKWVFYLNLPIGGTAIVCLFFFLHVNYQKEPWHEKVKRIDYTGNALLMTSIFFILLALTWGGTTYAWSNWRIIVCLLLGLIGMILFHAFEASPLCREPMMPPYIFRHRTSFIALVVSFVHNMLTFLVIYFIPVYFQAVKLSTSTRAGVQFLLSVILAVPTAIVADGLTKYDRYKPIHIFASAVILLGLGLFTLLDAESSATEWIIFQIITAIGLGLLHISTLAAVQVPLEEKDVGLATATWAFVRSHGAIWGIAIPAAIFNTEFARLSGRISNPAVSAQLAGGEAYPHVSSKFIESLAPQVQREVVSVYTDALKLVWYVSLAFAALAFIITFFEKELKLRTELETKYGIKDAKEGKEKESATEV